MQINDYLTTKNIKKGRTEKIKYIVIHYVGATGSAKANCKYYAENNVNSSAHYYVDFDGSVWRSVKDEDTAWHCGASKYVHPECRNANSIGIEMCVRNKGSKANTSKDWYFEDATVESAIELTRELMEKYGIDADHVIRHYDVTGKICPNPYVYNHTKHTWEDFKAGLVAKKGEWVQLSNGEWTYKEETGLAEGWREINGHWYYFKNNLAVKGYQEIGNERYYFETSGDLECALLHTNDRGALVEWNTKD